MVKIRGRQTVALRHGLKAPCLRRPVAVLIGRTAESIAAMQGVLYAGPAADAIAMVVAVVLTVRFFQQMNRQAKKG